MTNIQRQKWCDEQKWFTSEGKDSDQSGCMDWCDSCKYKHENGCKVNQLDREMNCLCATAYNKYNRKRKYVHGDGPLRRGKCLNCTKPASECKGECF